MGRLRFENAASWKLAAQITADATEITLETPEGLPVLAEGDYFYLTMEEGQNVEVVRVNGIVGETLTVVRGQDNTSASPFNAYVTIEMRVNAAILRDVIDERQALEQRCIESDAQLQANIDAQDAKVNGATAQLVSSAIRTMLADEETIISVGAAQVFSHISDPAMLRSTFIEKRVPPQVTSAAFASDLTEEPAPLTAGGETVLPLVAPMGSAISVAQTAIDASDSVTTAVSFDGGATFSEYARDHGSLPVPEGAAGLVVKVNLEAGLSFDKNSYLLNGDITTQGGTGFAWKGLGCSLFDNAHLKLVGKTGAATNNYWLAISDGAVNSHADLSAAVEATVSASRNISVGSEVTVDVSGNTATINMDDVTYTKDISGMADPSFILMTEIEGLFQITEGLGGAFNSVTFGVSESDRWLIDSENHWEVQLTSATTTTLRNVSTEIKDVRVRIGATSVVRYMYDRVIPAGAEEILQLPITHNNAAAVFLKTFVPGSQESDTRWDFDVIDADKWDGDADFVGGNMTLPEGATETLITSLSSIPMAIVESVSSISATDLYRSSERSSFFSGFNSQLLREDGGVNGAGWGSLNSKTLEEGDHVEITVNNGGYGWVFIWPELWEGYEGDPGTHGGVIVHSSHGAGQIIIDVIDGVVTATRDGESILSKPLADFADPRIVIMDEYSSKFTITKAESVVGEVRYALSFDGKQTWRTSGNAVLGINEVKVSGMTSGDLAAFDFSGVTLGDGIDVAIAIVSTVPGKSPLVDQITADVITKGIWVHDSPTPNGLLVKDEGEDQIMLVNNTDTEVSVKVRVDI